MISDSLETQGQLKEAYDLDIIANTFEKLSSLASLENYLKQIILYVKIDIKIFSYLP